MTRAFIAMPFAQEFYPVYKAIHAVCERLAVTTIRIDEIWAREDIYQQIEEEILKADFVIADFTGDRMLEVPNPNVVHEAAFARTHKKYVLLLAQDHKCLPFDWRTRPATIYQHSEEGLSYLQDRLYMAIEALMQKEDFGKDAMQIPSAQQQIFPYAMPTTNAYIDDTQRSPTSIIAIDNILNSREGAIPASDTLCLPEGFSRKQDYVISDVDGAFMVHIATCKFSMGAEEDEDQQPIHEAYLSDYLVDIYPVTNSAYSKFIEAGGYSCQAYWSPQSWNWRCRHKIETPAYFDNSELNQEHQPVVGISWYEAVAYATWAGKHLPTEAQWEYAARGQDQLLYPWGNQEPTSQLANYRPASAPTPVGKYNGVSPCGCYDMAGNVWEWCYDWYSETYYQQCPTCNPTGPKSGEEKVCRGGSWTYEKDTLKTFYRFCGDPTLRDRSYGFRCARIL